MCVAPNPAIDRVYEVEQLIPGAIHRPTVSVAVPGGKGLNVARTAHTLGADVVAVTILRGHAGKWIDEQLAQRGLLLRAAWASGETRTCISVRDPATDGLTEIYDPGQPVAPEAWAQLERIVAEELAGGAELMTISGGIPPGVDDGAFGRLCRAARQAGVRALVDAYGGGLAGALTERPWLVKVNEAEASGLLGTPLAGDEGALAAARELHDRGAEVAIVTRGRYGTAVAGPELNVVLEPTASNGPYPVGSGDAFLAGLATGLLDGRALPDALDLASRAAGANAQSPGPGELDPSAVRT
ncbi:MAG TPA: 1-phosphofructokinase family hexose kinase [Candidatus Limnocylindrales bacterium]|nr:1-phosphofructokinase family hexose kinase [Candidatus Limnocylindrales bacterium]